MERSGSYSYLVLCVDTLENGVTQGRCYYHDFTQVYHFCSMDQFILQADALLDGAQGEHFAISTESSQIRLNGKIATFKLRVPYRHNADWQGTVMWLETRHEESFRSVMELLSIIYQALAASQKQRMSPSSLKIAK